MKILSITPVNYKNASTNKDNSVSQNRTNSVYNAPYVTKVNFGNNLSILEDNFGEVTENLFRGRLPRTVKDFEALKAKGVTFILDLCGDENGKPNIEEAKMAKDFGMEYIYRNGKSYWLEFQKNKEDFLATLKLVKEKIQSGGRGYIHCEEGKSRTGLFVANYQARILGIKDLSQIKTHFIHHGGNKMTFDDFIQDTFIDF